MAVIIFIKIKKHRVNLYHCFTVVNSQGGEMDTSCCLRT